MNAVPRTAVLGAGFSGLAAAESLSRRGIDVTVYEARDRVGGRVWSAELETVAGRSVIERGAEFVLEGYDTFRSIATDAGLELVDTRMSYYVRDLAETPHVSTAEVAEAGRRATALLGSFAEEPSVAQVLDVLDASTEMKAALRTRIEISTACVADTVTAATLHHTAAFEPKPSWRVGGGNQRIAFHLAERLDGRIRFEDPVSAVRPEGDGYTVVSKGGEQRYDYVIVALPLSFVRDPGLLELPLSDRKRDVLTRIVQGHAAKLQVPLKTTPEPSAVMSVPGKFWSWTAEDLSGEIAPVVHSLVATEPGIDGIGARQGDERWIEELARIRPDLDFDLDAERSSTVWSEDPWARGGFSSHAPGWTDVDSREIRRPEEGLYLVGEYVDADFTCLMEGALRTGRAAADEVAVRIGRA